MIFCSFFCRLSNWKSVTRVHVYYVLLQLIDETQEGGMQLDTEISMSLLFNEDQVTIYVIYRNTTRLKQGALDGVQRNSNRTFEELLYF